MGHSKYSLRPNHGVYVCLMYTLISFWRICSSTVIEKTYVRVIKTIEQNYEGSILTTSYLDTMLACAGTCHVTQCMSYSYNSANRMCKTYSKKICYRCDGQISPTIMFYTLQVTFSFDVLSGCDDIPAGHCSGVYTITPTTSKTLDVFCDMDTAGGPWTVVAKRFDGSEDFYRTWNDYKVGFGNLECEFWLGFENLRILLDQNMKLRIEMEGWPTGLKYVEYSTFYISDEASKYVLTIGGYNSPDGLFDALEYHNGLPFSTIDIDHDNYAESCSDIGKGAWWYGYCLDSNLFGLYHGNTVYESMIWKYFYQNDTMYTAVKTARMMLIKP